MFALPWFLTWFGHSLNQYKDVVRLYDFFLATPSLMPLYVATSLVVERRNEILAESCDMASVHCLLSQIPDNLDFEAILRRARRFYRDYPPKSIENEVKKRVKKEYVYFNLFRRFIHVLKSLFTLRFCWFLATSLFSRTRKMKRM